MTVRELRDKLSRYNGDTEIKVAMNKRLEPLNDITIGYDVDTNVGYVWLCAEEDVDEG